MSSVAIVTDSNSGISQAEGKELGIYVIPMPCLVKQVTTQETLTSSVSMK